MQVTFHSSYGHNFTLNEMVRDVQCWLDIKSRKTIQTDQLVYLRIRTAGR